jgi:citrate synthase
MAAGTLSLADAGVDDDPRAAARLLVATFPTIVGAYWHLRHGQAPVPVRAELSHAASFLHQITGHEPMHDHVRGLETYLNTVADHGLNASTFAARVIVATRSDLISAALPGGGPRRKEPAGRDRWRPGRTGSVDNLPDHDLSLPRDEPEPGGRRLLSQE